MARTQRATVDYSKPMSEADAAAVEQLAAAMAATDEPDTSPAAVLRALVLRIERLHGERDELATAVRECFAEAKARGYDVPALRALITRRRKDRNAVEELEAVRDSYGAALDGTGPVPRLNPLEPHQIDIVHTAAVTGLMWRRDRHGWCARPLTLVKPPATGPWPQKDVRALIKKGALGETPDNTLIVTATAAGRALLADHGITVKEFV